MFITVNNHTINSDHIVLFERDENGNATLYLTGDRTVVLLEAEARELLGMLGAQTTPSTFRKQQQGSN